MSKKSNSNPDKSKGKDDPKEKGKSDPSTKSTNQAIQSPPPKKIRLKVRPDSIFSPNNDPPQPTDTLENKDTVIALRLRPRKDKSQKMGGDPPDDDGPGDSGDDDGDGSDESAFDPDADQDIDPNFLPFLDSDEYNSDSDYYNKMSEHEKKISIARNMSILFQVVFNSSRDISRLLQDQYNTFTGVSKNSRIRWSLFEMVRNMIRDTDDLETLVQIDELAALYKRLFDTSAIGIQENKECIRIIRSILESLKGVCSDLKEETVRAAKRSKFLPLLQLALMAEAKKLGIRIDGRFKSGKTRLLRRNFTAFVSFCQLSVIPYSDCKRLDPFFCRLCKSICFFKRAKTMKNQELMKILFPLRDIIPDITVENFKTTMMRFFECFFEYSEATEIEDYKAFLEMEMPRMIIPGSYGKHEERNKIHVCLPSRKRTKPFINVSCCTVQAQDKALLIDKLNRTLERLGMKQPDLETGNKESKNKGVALEVEKAIKEEKYEEPKQGYYLRKRPLYHYLGSEVLEKFATVRVYLRDELEPTVFETRDLEKIIFIRKPTK
jgi:hypothetical protein